VLDIRLLVLCVEMFIFALADITLSLLKTALRDESPSIKGQYFSRLGSDNKSIRKKLFLTIL